MFDPILELTGVLLWCAISICIGYALSAIIVGSYGKITSHEERKQRNETLD
jgi:hypothetical protein